MGRRSETIAANIQLLNQHVTYHHQTVTNKNRTYKTKLNHIEDTTSTYKTQVSFIGK